MNNRVEKRHIAEAYHVEVVRADGRKVRFIVNGETESGRRVQIKIDTSWSYWACIAANFQKAWAEERARRVMEMHRIDSALPRQL